MKFSVCIGSVRPAPLQLAIEAIRRQTWEDWELVVVGQGDDAALAAVGAEAMAQDKRVRYIHLEKRGVSLARNVAMHAADGDIVAITDDDCEASADWLATLAECFQTNPNVDVVGGSVVAPDSRRRWLSKCPTLIPAEALYDPVASGRRPPAGWNWWTANVALRPSVVQQAGPFDECFGPGAVFRVVTDVDYKLRLEANGVRMLSTPRAVVFHTSGYRSGFRALWKRSIDYSYGMGALAGKLTLQGDPRGREWLKTNQRELAGWLHRPRPERQGLSLVKLWTFSRGYRQCLRNYRLDTALGVLQRLARPLAG